MVGGCGFRLLGGNFHTCAPILIPPPSRRGRPCRADPPWRSDPGSAGRCTRRPRCPFPSLLPSGRARAAATSSKGPCGAPTLCFFRLASCRACSRAFRERPSVRRRRACFRAQVVRSSSKTASLVLLFPKRKKAKRGAKVARRRPRASVMLLRGKTQRIQYASWGRRCFAQTRVHFPFCST